MGDKEIKKKSLEKGMKQHRRYLSKFENMDYRYPKLKAQNKQLKEQLTLAQLNSFYLMGELKKLKEQHEKIKMILKE